MTYFHMRDAHYHRREVVSLSCSRWEGVGPTCYGRQTNWCQGSGIRDQESVLKPNACLTHSEEVKNLSFDCCEHQESDVRNQGSVALYRAMRDAFSDS